jgi:hypothetical protein
MQIVPRMAASLQSVFNHLADQLAVECRVIRRERKFRGSTLVQTLVFGWLSKPMATLEQLAQQAAVFAVNVSPQAIAKRFTMPLVEYLQRLLEIAAHEAIGSEPKAIALLQRFQGVFINDSTVVNLPTQFADRWPACGGDAGQSEAALKFQLRLDYQTGHHSSISRSKQGEAPTRAALCKANRCRRVACV